MEKDAYYRFEAFGVWDCFLSKTCRLVPLFNGHTMSVSTSMFNPLAATLISSCVSQAADALYLTRSVSIRGINFQASIRDSLEDQRHMTGILRPTPNLRKFPCSDSLSFNSGSGDRAIRIGVRKVVF